MNKTKWLPIPKYNGYFVSDSNSPRIKLKSGEITTKRATIYNSTGKALTITPRRALYAARLGVSPDFMPKRYWVVGADKKLKILDSKDNNPRLAKYRELNRLNKGLQAYRLKRNIEFLKLQLKAITSNEYEEVYSFLLSMQDEAFAYSRRWATKLIDEDKSEALVMVIEDIKKGAAYSDPLKAICSKLTTIANKRKIQRLIEISRDATSIKEPPTI